MSDHRKYAQMKARGASAEQIYLQAREDEISLINSMKLLRELFDLSLLEAKEISTTASGEYESLDEYQASLIPIIEEVIKSAQDEEDNS